ncbi:MAG TPA: hypothetical protein VEA35_15290 [Ramlibacter sp.]|nr:hypothetical protein [Ramlibacter sp.]
MTVHALPGAESSDAAARTVRGRWKMLAVMLVCAAPVIASYFTYYVIRPEGRRNFGELIEPQRPVPAALSSLKGQWLLVSVASGACDARCENHLYLQRQLREGLGKDKERVDWVWLVDDQAPVRDALRPALAQAQVVNLERSQLAQWLAPAPGQQLADHLYMVDPMGNWMMRFPAHVDKSTAPKVKRDIERLLRASASWDKPGRTAP